MTTNIKAAQHLDEQELNKLLKYLSKNQLWTYYIMVRLGVSTALRFSDLSNLTWGDVLLKKKITIKEKKTKKTREIPIGAELQEVLLDIHTKLKKPQLDRCIIPLHIRTVNKQIKIHAAKAGIRGKRISTHTWRKTFGREVWRRNNYSEASLIKLSLLFNHSSTAITRIYLDITREEVGDLYDIEGLFVY
jgi:integrase